MDIAVISILSLFSSSWIFKSSFEIHIELTEHIQALKLSNFATCSSKGNFLRWHFNSTCIAIRALYLLKESSKKFETY